MPFLAVPESLRKLVAQLPFGLDETEQAGAAFQRWRSAPGGEGVRDKRVVDLWTYCFVRRYFLVKFAVNEERPASDLDELVERVYRKVEAKRAGVRRPELYAHWVSVVCKNTFINYVNRGRPPDVSLDADDAPPMHAEQRVRGDLGLARDVVARAVERLPDYLRPVAHMRFLEGRSYKEIGRETDNPVPTTRTYAARARAHLRADPTVQALLDESG